MTIYFELEENPKGTAQQKGVAYQGGRIHHYEKKEVRQMREIYHHKIFKVLYTNKVTAPNYQGPVSLKVIFNFSIKQRNKWGQPKTSAPDVDNLVKLLIDAMSDLNFWRNDSQVAKLEVRKFYAEKPSIYIEVDDYGIIRTEAVT